MKHYRVLTLLSGRRQVVLCALAYLLAVSGGCSKDKVQGPDTQSNITVEANQKLPSAPHRFDVYRPETADKAVVCLHGGGGTKHMLAYQLGIKRDIGSTNYAVANEEILIDTRAIVVFPQGQAIGAAPAAYTWSNYVMNSGEDDVQFIRDLVSHIRTRYNVDKIYIVGHSNGAMMAGRLWCEAPELFDAYVAISGPPSEHFSSAGPTPCSPTVAKPFLSIVGAQDNVLQNGVWEAQTWTIDPVLAASPAFVDPDVIGDRYFLPTKVTERCSDIVQAGDADAVTDGNLVTWSFCGGSIRLIRVESGGHPLDSLESASGHSMMQLVFDFINSIQ